MNKSLIVLLLALLMVSSLAFQLRTQDKDTKPHHKKDHGHKHGTIKPFTEAGNCECTCACDLEFTHEGKHSHKHKDKHDDECEDDDHTHKKHDHKHKDHKDKDHKHKDHKHKDDECKDDKPPKPKRDIKCGESHKIYDSWQAYKSKAWQAGKTKCDVVDMCIQGAKKAGADDKLATCIGAHCGTGTGMETCEIVDYMEKWANKKWGASKKDAEKWVNKSMKKIYSWYTDDTCC